MSKAKSKPSAQPPSAQTGARYRITLKVGEKIRIAGETLRPDRKHVVSAKVFEANKSKIESHEAV